MANVRTCYVSCGCNRTPHCASWGQNSLICYGGCRAIVLFSPKAPSQVKCVATGHKDRVNCVTWIQRQNQEDENELVSCSSDKTIIVWRLMGGKVSQVEVLTGHLSAVSVVSGLYVPNKDGRLTKTPRTLLASASMDSTVKIWAREENAGDFMCIQTVSFGTGFALDLAWIVLPAAYESLLAIGGDDYKVSLLVEENSQFVTKLKLFGHEDWVRGLEFTVDDGGDVLLASCSQDNFIRIWRISQRTSSSTGNAGSHTELKVKEKTFSLESSGEQLQYAVSLESVLQGHENWIYSVHWQPPIMQGGKPSQPMHLLSASMDKTMIIWEPDEESGIWTEKVRVGDVGGNALGFYGGIFSPDGRSILAHGYQGAFYLWNQKMETASWEPAVTVGGHFDSVEDLAWEPRDGHFLISVSLDQTTRVHAYWEAARDGAESSWHEVARPQVHGYDIHCVMPITQYRFASGADEKVVRIFEAPRNFIQNLGQISGIDVRPDLDNASAPDGGSVPALGLSNKAVFSKEKDTSLPNENPVKSTDQYVEAYFSPLNLNAPPSEVDLVQNTLWPEVQKLYGHGYELYTMASNPDGSLLASVCKASKVEHAAILLWDTATWRMVCKLSHHQLTVTQLRFSRSGEYLLSVSRDRTWALYRQRLPNQPSEPLFSKVAFSDKKSAVHSRIIWSCDWSPDDRYFITVSRDKKAVIWRCEQGKTADSGDVNSCGPVGTPLVLGHAITAVSFAPITLERGRYLIALGLDDGCILLYTWSADDQWKHCLHLQQSDAHHLTVNRLAFRPKAGDADGLLLASCGADHMLRIISIQVKS